MLAISNLLLSVTCLILSAALLANAKSDAANTASPAQPAGQGGSEGLADG